MAGENCDKLRKLPHGIALTMLKLVSGRSGGPHSHRKSFMWLFFRVYCS